MKFKKPLPMVVVKWLDAHSTGEWARESEYLERHRTAKNLVTYTCGFLLASDRRALTVVQSVSPDNDTMADSITIPRSCVRKIRRLP